MSNLSFPENLLIIPGLAPHTGTGGAETSIPISLKNVQKMWAVVYLDTATTSAAVAIVPQSDSLVAFGDPAVIPTTLHDVPIWSNQSAATNDLWTRETDDSVFTTAAADALMKMVVFEIDPEVIATTATAAVDHDCFRVSLTALGIGDNAAVFYIVQPRYISKADTRSYIVD